MISGEKVIIRGLTKNDAKDIYNWVNQEDLRTLTGTLYPISEYEHQEWMQNVTTSQNKKLFLVADKQTGESLGTIGLKNFDYINRNVELFISLAVSGGYGTDAVHTLVEYCFNHLNMHKVYLYVFESNTRAQRCYEKAGFKKEGILVDHHFSNGKYENVFVMGITNC